MRTEKQIAASRANGAKSKGPRALRQAPYQTQPDQTQQDHPHQNQTHYERRHLDLANTIVHPHESRRAFLRFCTHLDEQFHPENAFEQMIVGRIAAAHWRQLRCWRHERDAARAVAAAAEDTAQQAAPAQISQEPNLLTHSTEPAAPSPTPQPTPSNNPPRTAPPPINPIAEHRLDTAFYRGISAFYRLRAVRKSVRYNGLGKCTDNCRENPDILLKSLDKSPKTYPTNNPAETQETPASPPLLANPEALDVFITSLETTNPSPSNASAPTAPGAENALRNTIEVSPQIKDPSDR